MIMDRKTTYCIVTAWIFGASLWATRTQGTEFVVDQGHAAASDLNPGTAEKPFKAIRAAVDKAQPATRSGSRQGST